MPACLAFHSAQVKTSLLTWFNSTFENNRSINYKSENWNKKVRTPNYTFGSPAIVVVSISPIYIEWCQFLSTFNCQFCVPTFKTKSFSNEKNILEFQLTRFRNLKDEMEMIKYIGTKLKLWQMCRDKNCYKKVRVNYIYMKGKYKFAKTSIQSGSIFGVC